MATLRKFLGNESSVSSVVGTVLMLGITVAVFGGLSLMVSNYFAQENAEVRADLGVVQSANAYLLVHQGGEGVDLSSATVRINLNGSDVDVPSSFLQTAANGGSWDLGETVCLAGPQPPCYTDGTLPIFGAVFVAGNSILLSDGRLSGISGTPPPDPCIAETTPPAVVSWALSPLDVNIATSGNVYVTIVADDACAAVNNLVNPTLYYSLVSSPPATWLNSSVPMAVNGTDTWQGTISNAPWSNFTLGTFRYYVSGLADSNGNVAGPSATQEQSIEFVSATKYVSTNSTVLGQLLNFDAATSAGDDGAPATLVEASTSGSTLTSALNGTTHTNSGATNPQYVLASDDQHATLATDGNWVEAAAFSTPVGAASVSQVLIGFEGKGPTGTPTVALSQQVSGASNAAPTVASGNVTATVGLTYVAVVAHGDDTNPNVAVSSVSGLGLNWTKHQAVVSGMNNAGRGQMEMWVGSGTLGASSAVTATFAASIESAIIWVTSWSGADAVSPIQASATGFNSATSTSWSISSLAGTATQGRFAAFVNAVSATTVTFVNPTTEPVAEVDNADVHLAFAHSPAATTNAGSGTIGTAVRWQAIAFTIRPSTAAPAVQMTYRLSGGQAGLSNLTTSLSGGDIVYTLNVTSDRAWTVADIVNLAVRVEATSLSGGQAQIDHAFVTVTTTTSATYSLNIEFNWTGVQAGPNQTLVLRYSTTGDTFRVDAWNGTAWRTCPGDLTAIVMTSYSCPLALPSEYNSGSPRIRFVDVTSSGTAQGFLYIDYARMVTT